MEPLHVDMFNELLRSIKKVEDNHAQEYVRRHIPRPLLMWTFATILTICDFLIATNDQHLVDTMRSDNPECEAERSPHQEFSDYNSCNYVKKFESSIIVYLASCGVIATLLAVLGLAEGRAYRYSRQSLVMDADQFSRSLWQKINTYVPIQEGDTLATITTKLADTEQNALSIEQSGNLATSTILPGAAHHSGALSIATRLPDDNSRFEELRQKIKNEVRKHADEYVRRHVAGPLLMWTFSAISPIFVFLMATNDQDLVDTMRSDNPECESKLFPHQECSDYNLLVNCINLCNDVEKLESSISFDLVSCVVITALLLVLGLAGGLQYMGSRQGLVTDAGQFPSFLWQKINTYVRIEEGDTLATITTKLLNAVQDAPDIGQHGTSAIPNTFVRTMPGNDLPVASPVAEGHARNGGPLLAATLFSPPRLDDSRVPLLQGNVLS